MQLAPELLGKADEVSAERNSWAGQIAEGLNTVSGNNALQPLSTVQPLRMVDEAIRHARDGWAVFPLVPGEKIPIKGTHGSLDATSDEATIRQMWAAHPFANIGGVPSMSGRLVVDVDPRHGGDKSMDWLVEEHGPNFLRTTTTLTGGGGQHLVYSTGGQSLPSSKSALGKGIDIIANTYYVVLPPSLHPNGQRYEYEEGFSPEEVGYQPVPKWLVERLLSRSHTRGRSLPTFSTADIEETIRKQGGLRGEMLAATAGDPAFAEAACRVMNFPMRRLGSPFCCVLPGHVERHPSASVFRNNEGYYTYHDMHARDGSAFYTLPEVRYILAAGEVRHLSHPEIAVWHLRLLLETGHAAPADVKMPPLRLGASGTLARVYRGFELLLQCKWLYEYGEPTAFSRDFAAVWCGVTARQAWCAIEKLLKEKYIALDGKHKRSRLFLPHRCSHEASYR